MFGLPLVFAIPISIVCIIECVVAFAIVASGLAGTCKDLQVHEDVRD